MVEGDGGMFDHDGDSLVEFIVVRVQIHSLLPQHELLAGPQQLRRVKLLHVGLAVLHEFFRTVFSVQDGEFCEDTDVGTFQSNSCFQHAHHLVGHSQTFIVFDESLEFIRMHDDVHRCDVGEFVLLSRHTRYANFPPSLSSACLLSVVDGSRVLL